MVAQVLGVGMDRGDPMPVRFIHDNQLLAVPASSMTHYGTLGSDTMNVILFGASGMVGQGVLRECLLDPGFEKVLSMGRSRTGQQNVKLQEIVHADISNLGPIEDQLKGYDACFFTLGVSSAGMKEADYRRITYDLTLGAARTLAAARFGAPKKILESLDINAL
jgi:hypothetical protein